ncbi:MAG: hypothetical protein L3J41_05755 [Melioribacteraceae bacterium]|nr:hypothetical protein [Melioribacteraceae bacterium]
MINIIFAALLLFSSIVSAQENYKGKISLIFNDEKIELPIKVVSLRKENKVLISIRAERNTEDIQQLFSLEWEFKKLSTDDKDLSMYDAFLLNVINNRKDKKEELRFRMNNNATDGELFVKKGKRTWDLTSFAMRFEIENISFENSAITIKGGMSLKARDVKSKTPLEAVSEIKDCKFEIVI